MDFEVGETVRINTPGESHHEHTGKVIHLFPNNKVAVDLGDVRWMYSPDELIKESK